MALVVRGGLVGAGLSPRDLTPSSRSVVSTLGSWRVGPIFQTGFSAVTFRQRTRGCAWRVPAGTGRKLVSGCGPWPVLPSLRSPRGVGGRGRSPAGLSSPEEVSSSRRVRRKWAVGEWIDGNPLCTGVVLRQAREKVRLPGVRRRRWVVVPHRRWQSQASPPPEFQTHQRRVRGEVAPESHPHTHLWTAKVFRGCVMQRDRFLKK